MKRLVAMMVVSLITLSVVCAQVTIGGRLGLHLNTGSVIDFPGDMEEGGGFNIVAYGRYNFGFHTPFGVQTELNFNFTNGLNKAPFRYTYNALDLPVVVTYDLNVWRFTFTFRLGPNFHFPLGNVKYQKEKEDFELTYDTISKSSLDYYITVGAVGGITTAINFSEKHAMVLDIQYLHDFIPIKVDGNKMFTRGDLAFTLGYQHKFNLK